MRERQSGSIESSKRGKRIYSNSPAYSKEKLSAIAFCLPSRVFTYTYAQTRTHEPKIGKFIQRK